MKFCPPIACVACGVLFQPRIRKATRYYRHLCYLRQDSETPSTQIMKLQAHRLWNSKHTDYEALQRKVLYLNNRSL